MIIKFDEYIMLESLDSINFVYDDDLEDNSSITINALDGKEKVGSVTIEENIDAYWYFEDDFTEDEYSEMFPDGGFMKIEHLEIKYKRSGLARKLMLLAIEKVKEMGYHQIYLNASPMGFEGLNITDLVWFYKGFGFKEILNQGHNVQMLLNI